MSFTLIQKVFDFLSQEAIESPRSAREGHVTVGQQSFVDVAIDSLRADRQQLCRLLDSDLRRDWLRVLTHGAKTSFLTS